MGKLYRAFGFFVLVAFVSNSSAGLIEVNLSAPLSSAVINVPSIDDEQMSFSVSAPSFIVNVGDTVRVIWTFTNDDTFQLLADPHIGLQGWLRVADPLELPYSAQFAPSWSLLDRAGTTVLFGAEPRQGSGGGDLHSGGLTVSLATAIDVWAVTMELSNFVDTSSLSGASGGLPVEFNGADFLIHNALFGSPFNNTPPLHRIPEPISLALLVIGLAGLGFKKRKTCRQRIARA